MMPVKPGFKLANADQIDALSEVVKTWWEEGNPANMFLDCRHTTYYSIMEFLANKEGLTVYPNGAS